MSSVPVHYHKHLLATDRFECLYLRRWIEMPLEGGTLSGEQHCGGFSQLTCCQSAVKQVLCSLCSVCSGHGEWWPCAPCPSPALLPSAWCSSTQWCLPFMGWSLGGRHRGDGVTPWATALIYCIDAEGVEMEVKTDTASIYAWMDWFNSAQLKIAFSLSSNLTLRDVSPLLMDLLPYNNRRTDSSLAPVQQMESNFRSHPTTTTNTTATSSSPSPATGSRIDQFLLFLLTFHENPRQRGWNARGNEYKRSTSGWELIHKLCTYFSC